MFSKYIGILVLLSTFHFSFGQGLSFADKNFENYEFSIAKNLYNDYLLKGSIDQEHAEKLGYCYYITSDYTGLTFIDSLIKTDESVDFLWFWKASLEKDKGEYEKAAESFEKFQKLNQTLDVSVQIESCKKIPTWPEMSNAKVESTKLNDRYANSTKFSDNNQFYFFENGIDSIGKSIERASASADFSEVVMMKPFILVDTKMIEIQIPGMENYVINSFVKLSNSNEVIFDGIDLGSEKIYSKIYSGNLSEKWVVTNVKPVEELNQKDLVSIGQPTITSDGNTLIFAGISFEKNNLYRATRTNGVYGNVESLNAINSPGDDCYPVIIGDTLLSFSSDGKVGYGGLDIYVIPLAQITDASKIIHYTSPVNSTMDEFNFNWMTDSTAEFVSNRGKGQGDDDIWKLTITPKEITLPPISDGFDAWLEKWQSYKIYFGFDSSIAKVDPTIIDGLNKHSEKYGLDLKLTGHTDSQGRTKYNQILGQERANYVRDELNSKLSTKGNIETLSIGENGIINNCTNGVKCSDKEHLENRFVELVITPKKTTR